MEENHKKEISKFLSYILRHHPQSIGLDLDENGWADIATLLIKAARHNQLFSRQQLEEVVITNDKQRFVFDETRAKIRASQGHSIEVELNLVPVIPPEFLFHGTVGKFIEAIKKQGLKKMKRQHVHLSDDNIIAEKVGSRRGKAIILEIKSELMHKDGFNFYRSENGVWLTGHVPVKYIKFNGISS